MAAILAVGLMIGAGAGWLAHGDSDDNGGDDAGGGSSSETHAPPYCEIRLSGTTALANDDPYVVVYTLDGSSVDPDAHLRVTARGTVLYDGPWGDRGRSSAYISAPSYLYEDLRQYVSSGSVWIDGVQVR